MKIRGSLVFFGALAAVMAGGLAARADTVALTLSYTGDYVGTPGNWLSTQISSPYLAAGYASSDGVYHGDFIAAPSNFTVTLDPTVVSTYNTKVTTNDVYKGENLQAFCVDLNHLINGSVSNPYTGVWDVANLADISPHVNGLGVTTPDQVNAIKALWAEHSGAALTYVADAQAFQVALWNLLYNYYGYATNAVVAPTLTVGTSTYFSASDDGWALQAWTTKASHTDESVYALVNEDTTQTQSFSVILYGTGGDPVPLPASVGVGFSMLAGFGAFFGLRKRLSRRPRIA